MAASKISLELMISSLSVSLRTKYQYVIGDYFDNWTLGTKFLYNRAGMITFALPTLLIPV